MFPVSPSATSWLMSRGRCVDNLLHAAALAPRAMSQRPVCTLPALRLTMAAYANALAAHHGHDAASLVSFEPDPALEAQFGAYPEARLEIAESLGFCADGSAEELIRRSFVAAATPSALDLSGRA